MTTDRSRQRTDSPWRTIHNARRQKSRELPVSSHSPWSSSATTHYSGRSSCRAMPSTPRATFSRTKRNFASRSRASSHTTSAALFCSAALYVIFAPVNRGLALAGALFRLVFVMLWLVAPLNSLGALRLLGDSTYLQVFEPERLQALARVQIAASFDDYYVGLPFFGLAATVCAWLWLKSNYIPSGLAIFGVIASAWCVLCAFVYPHLSRLQQNR